MDALRTIERVAAKSAPGRSPSFAEAHLLKALEDISFQKTVGRMKLGKDLQLGEGEARTLIKHMKNEGLIEISKSGISLSTLGTKLLSNLRTFISEPKEIPVTSLTLGKFNIAIKINGAKTSVKYGLEQRDAAIIAGAKGATTLIYSKKRIYMPGTNEDISTNDPSLSNALKTLNLKENDVIIIGSADEKTKAELGAQAAAIELLKFKG
jgi:DNA-binding transcriptional regulator LsrR (DeoR family)